MFNMFRGRSVPPVVDAAEMLGNARNVEDVIALLHRHARVVAGADGITVVRREGDEVAYVTEDAIAPLWAGQRFALRTCVTGMAILAGEPIVIPDIARDPRVPLHLYLSTFVRSMAVFPVGGTAPAMALGLYWREARPPEPAALARVATLARQAGAVLDRIGRDGDTARAA